MKIKTVLTAVRLLSLMETGWILASDTFVEASVDNTVDEAITQKDSGASCELYVCSISIL